MAVTLVGTCIVQGLSLTGETVVGDGAVPVLLILEDMQNLAYSLNPLLVEDAGIAGLLPIGISKPQRLAK